MSVDSTSKKYMEIITKNNIFFGMKKQSRYHQPSYGVDPHANHWHDGGFVRALSNVRQTSHVNMLGGEGAWSAVQWKEKIFNVFVTTVGIWHCQRVGIFVTIC